MIIVSLLLDIIAAFVTAVERADLLPLAATAALFFSVGQSIAKSKPQLHTCGRNLGGLACVGYATFAVIAGDNVLSACLRGLLAGGIIAGFSWFLLPAAAPAGRRLWGTLLVCPYRLVHRLAGNVAQRKRRRADETRRLHEQHEWERAAPEREHARCQAQERALLERRQQLARENCRFACQLLYDRLMPEQKECFPQERFAAYFEEYLSDAYEPGEVQRRAQKLQQMIIENFSSTRESTCSFSSIKDIADHFQKRRQEIEALGYDGKMTDVFLALLATEEQNAIRRFLSP